MSDSLLQLLSYFLYKKKANYYYFSYYRWLLQYFFQLKFFETKYNSIIK